MKRRMPRWIKTTIIAVVFVLALMAGTYAGLMILISKTQAAYEEIASVDLTAMEDGVYNGKAGGFICSMDLDVSVKDHHIADITVNRQVNGGGKYQAADMLPRIMEKQSLEVDTVSGATLTSKTILIAVHRALAGGIR